MNDLVKTYIEYEIELKDGEWEATINVMANGVIDMTFKKRFATREAAQKTVDAVRSQILAAHNAIITRN